MTVTEGQCDGGPESPDVFLTYLLTIIPDSFEIFSTTHPLPTPTPTTRRLSILLKKHLLIILMSSSIHSSLPAPALQASKAALNAALSDIESSELGEVQEIEVDMALQAETLKTVFNDPKNFNVKVRDFLRLFSFLFSFGREDSRCFSRPSI